jgi:hypothetical protein
MVLGILVEGGPAATPASRQYTIARHKSCAQNHVNAMRICIHNSWSWREREREITSSHKLYTVLSPLYAVMNGPCLLMAYVTLRSVHELIYEFVLRDHCYSILMESNNSNLNGAESYP